MDKLAMLGAVLFSTCSLSICHGEETTPPKVNRCIAAGQISSESLAVLSELQIATEKGLLYTIPATAVGVKDCHISDESGILQLEYQFKEGGWLRAIRDDRIEYSMEEARYTLPSKDDPEAIMKSELQSWFGGVDCGLDWKKPKVEPADDDANAMETVYWGEDCNCSVRIRRDPASRVIGLRISSVCN